MLNLDLVASKLNEGIVERVWIIEFAGSLNKSFFKEISFNFAVLNINISTRRVIKRKQVMLNFLFLKRKGR